MAVCALLFVTTPAQAQLKEGQTKLRADIVKIDLETKRITLTHKDNKEGEEIRVRPDKTAVKLDGKKVKLATLKPFVGKLQKATIIVSKDKDDKLVVQRIYAKKAE